MKLNSMCFGQLLCLGGLMVPSLAMAMTPEQEISQIETPAIEENQPVKLDLDSIQDPFLEEWFFGEPSLIDIENTEESEHAISEDGSNKQNTDEETFEDSSESKKKETNTDQDTLDITGRAEPPMWRLSDDDSEIWLLGTFHILPPDLDWRSNPLAHAIDNAETIFFEAEVDAPETETVTRNALITEGFLPKGETLSGLLEPDEVAKLQAVTTEIGVPFEAFDRMRPWQAFLAASVQFIVTQGFDPGSGVESVLLKEARFRDRKLEFFETVEQQLLLFTSLPPDVELDLLKITLRDWDNQDKQFSLLFNAWRNGDAETIDELMNDSMRDQAPEVYDTLIKHRNEVWVDRIETVMAGKGRVLIAVGAGHLVGDDSVPSLLISKGFEVERYGVGK